MIHCFVGSALISVGALSSGVDEALPSRILRTANHDHARHARHVLDPTQNHQCVGGICYKGLPNVGSGASCWRVYRHAKYLGGRFRVPRFLVFSFLAFPSV